MADISQLEVNGTTYDICDATARDSLSNYVLKTGDTMTGDLLVDTSRVRTLSNSIERGNPGSGSIYGGGSGFQVCDKDGKQIGYIQPVQWSDGSESIQIGVSSYGGSSTDYNALEIGFKANGDKYFNFGGGGGADAFRSAAWAACKPSPLYNNTSGSNGTITLAQSATTCTHMRIYYKSTDDATHQVSSVDVYQPNGKVVILGCVDGWKSGNTWFQSRLVKINGTSIATFDGNNTHACIPASGSTTSNVANYIYILRVEGWNE